MTDEITEIKKQLAAFSYQNTRQFGEIQRSIRDLKEVTLRKIQDLEDQMKAV